MKHEGNQVAWQNLDGEAPFTTLRLPSDHDILTALRRVLAHVELEKRLDRVSVIDADLCEFHIRPDEGFEFCR